MGRGWGAPDFSFRRKELFSDCWGRKAFVVLWLTGLVGRKGGMTGTEDSGLRPGPDTNVGQVTLPLQRP